MNTSVEEVGKEIKSLFRTYIPEAAVERCCQLVLQNKVQLKVVQSRKTKHGDFRELPQGRHLITVNAMSNPYRFLLTFIHEVAHLVVFEQYGRKIKPHGPEWKMTFQRLMLPFLTPQIWPEELLSFLASYLKNPKASSDTDIDLGKIMKLYDPKNKLVMVSELQIGDRFVYGSKRTFELGKLRRRRYECKELDSGRKFLFSPLAEVELVQ